MYGAGTWALHSVDHKELESPETWCCRRMEKIGLMDRVINEEEVGRVK